MGRACLGIHRRKILDLMDWPVRNEITISDRFVIAVVAGGSTVVAIKKTEGVVIDEVGRGRQGPR